MTKYYIGTQKGNKFFGTNETEIWKIEDKTAWFWERRNVNYRSGRGGWVKYRDRDCSSILNISIQKGFVREIKDRELDLYLTVHG